MINWALLPKGKAFRRNGREDMEEIFVITKGRVAVEVNGIKASLQAGDTLIVAPNERHEMLNISDDEVEYLVVGIAGSKNGKTVVE